jgi:hypothetical protein
MNGKFSYSVVVAASLLINLTSGRAQTDPTSPPALPAVGAAVVMRRDVGVQGFQFVSGEPSVATHTVKGAPYSLEATIESTQTLSDGNRIVHQQSVHLYRDSKGRTRREETLAAIGPWAASGSPPTMITIQDPVLGVSYFLDPQQKVATKVPVLPAGKDLVAIAGGPGTASVGSAHVGVGFVSPGEEGMPVTIGAYAGPGSQDLHPDEEAESLGTESIAGISTDGTQTTTTIPANAVGNERPLDIVRERWYSSDLQIVLRSKQIDPRFGETVYNVTKIDRSEPPSSLFEVPSGYTIRKGEAHMIIRHEAESK